MSQLDLLYKRINDDLEVTFPVTNEKSEIAQFYAHKTLFITGATGFMGKCLVEKLLRSCPDIKHLYILMRSKNNYTVEERTNRYFQNMIFDQLRRLNPNFLEKISILQGDLSMENLGISKLQRNTLINETNIIIHNGANVKFEVKVSSSLKTNVLGTKFMIDLADECKNLEMFLYVSSAYSHCYRQVIEEEFYISPMDLDNIYKTIKKDEEVENGLSEEEVHKLLGHYPNIYIFSKATAEEVVRKYGLISKFPVAIYRPSIVTSAYKEPLPGWLGNLNGPVYGLIGVGLGLIHTIFLSDLRSPMDLVPSDYVINLLIAIPWDTSVKWQTENKTVIYNYGSSVANPITFAGFYKKMYKFRETDISLNTAWMPWLIITKNWYFFWILHIIFHFIPACLLDLGLMLTGRKPQAVSIFMRITKNLDKIFYFSNGNWKIYMRESRRLIKRLNSVDREVFFCDINELDWTHYLLILCRGIKWYILKESFDAEAMRKKYKQIWYLHYGAIAFLIFLIGYFLISIILQTTF